MRHRNHYFLLGIAILFLAALLVDLAGTAGSFTVFGRGTGVHEGLDLVGGLSVDLEARDHHVATSDAMNAALEVITKRVNAFGVSEPRITRYGSYGIDVEIPGVNNLEQIRSTLGSTGQLHIYGMGTLPQLSSGDPFPYTVTKFCDTSGATVPCTVLDGSELDLSSINAGSDPITSQPVVYFSPKGAGAGRMQAYTSANDHIGHMAIVLDGTVVADPSINGVISNDGEITNIGSLSAARAIGISLKYGALPIAFSVAASSQVSASLGQHAVHDAQVAGIVGLATVACFLTAYYRLPGLLASTALLIYTTESFAIFKLVPVTLTLAGVAGFILSVGMAVDANILIFERLKEELRSGKTLGASIEAGFNRAWTSVRDSNISTMITCVVLYWFGQTYGASTIAGFALTLGIGVAVSMFTAIFVTRTFLRALVRSNRPYDPAWFGTDLKYVAATENEADRGAME